MRWACTKAGLIVDLIEADAAFVNKHIASGKYDSADIVPDNEPCETGWRRTRAVDIRFVPPTRTRCVDFFPLATKRARAESLFDAWTP